MNVPTSQVASPTSAPGNVHRTSYLVLGAALLVALAIAAGIAAIVASGNHQQKPTTPSTTQSAAPAATRALAAAAAAIVQNKSISLKPAAGWKVSKGDYVF